MTYIIKSQLIFVHINGPNVLVEHLNEQETRNTVKREIYTVYSQ